jgi:hypothetical protein
MSHRTETDSDSRTGTPRQGGYGRDASGDRAAHLDVIACDGCGRSFATPDGPGMLAMIKGACPDCGGRFEMIDLPPDHLL